MAGKDFSGPQVLSHLEVSTETTLLGCAWVPCSSRFVTLGSKMTGEGIIQTYAMTSTELKPIATGVRPKAIKCGTFGATSLEERHFATGDFEGKLCLWDLENMKSPISVIEAHDGFINAIDGVAGLGIGRGAPELATASRDGTIKVWDLRVRDRPVALMQPKEGQKTRDAWAVAFGDCHDNSNRLLTAGYDNGDLKLFDLKAMKPLWEKQLPNGICSLQFDRKDIARNKLLATCLEGRFHVFDLHTQHSEKGFAEATIKHERATLWQGKHLPQNRDVFMTSGGSGEVSLWKYEYPTSREMKDAAGELEGVPGDVKKLQSSQLGEQPIGGFDWSPDKMGLAVAVGFDQKIRIVIVTRLNLV